MDLRKFWRSLSYVTSTSCLVLLGLLLLNVKVKGQSCGPRVSARLLTEIPCDMDKSSYCTAPGSAYPWHSVRRYIFENQGLVRRMYGDERHSAVLRNEIDTQRFRYEANNAPNYRRADRGRAATETKSRRRPRPQILSPETTETSYKRFTATEFPATDETIFRVVTETSVKVDADTTTTPLASTQTTTTQQSSIAFDAAVSITPDYVTIETNTQPISEKPTSRFNPGSTALLETTTSELPTTLATETVRKTTTAASTSTVAKTSIESSDVTTPAITIYNDEEELLVEETFGDGVIVQSKEDIISENSVDEKQPLMEEIEEVEETKKEEEAVPRRGVNACPVKNEVIAPYWANNTRGETLALLNVYPFEQYVHFEKCAFENHQMLCREGCRCEQQYRLHRLLAFDPKNECRGIFSDWFRFPSCCVCICYDVTPDLPRTRSRTGRMK